MRCISCYLFDYDATSWHNGEVIMNQECPQYLSIGMKAPDFTAVTTMGPLKMSDLKGKWVILFSHPGDFTPV